MITIPGQLAIKTIHGSRGDFNVGKLITSIGEFAVKNHELEQYAEGKYDGEFLITLIRQAAPYFVGSRMIVETRAELAGMTLSSSDSLSAEDANRVAPPEPDPLDEENQRPQAATPVPAAPVEQPPTPINPLLDTTQFGSEPAAQSKPEAEAIEAADAELFGVLWPLTHVVKLDSTVNRGVIRRQCARLGTLGFEFDPLKQEWNRAAA